MDIAIPHRPRAIRDQIVDREVRRLELLQRAKREGSGPPPRPAPRARHQLPS